MSAWSWTASHWSSPRPLTAATTWPRRGSRSRPWQPAGSIAGVDEGGALVVGPESAGSVPGPACYGKGGIRPTVTDSDVVLGVIDPERFAGGRLRLRRDLAEDAIRKHVAEPLGMSVEAAADGIRRVVDAQMADQVRAATIQRGHDPRDFVLFAYGGAGPVHAHAFAPDAGIGRIVIPHTATVHSAYGALGSDRFRLYQATDRQRTPPWADDPATYLDPDRINERFGELEQRCRADFAAGPGPSIARYLHIRYRGQAGELAVPVPGPLAETSLRELIADFHRRYERCTARAPACPRPAWRSARSGSRGARHRRHRRPRDGAAARRRRSSRRGPAAGRSSSPRAQSRRTCSPPTPCPPGAR